MGKGEEERKDWCNGFAELMRLVGQCLGFFFMEVDSVCCPQIIGFFISTV